MNIGKILLGLGLSAVFITAAMFVGIAYEAYFDMHEGIVWFIFGGCYFNVATKLGL